LKTLEDSYQAKPIATWNSEMGLWLETNQSLLSELQVVFSEIWPTSGMMLDGQVFVPQKQERHTKETESSLLPTPAPGHIRNNDEPIENYLNRVSKWEQGEYRGKPGISLGVAIRMETLPTPIARDHKDGPAPHYRNGAVQVDSVARAIFHSGEISENNNQIVWGKFEPAIRQWEEITGRKAPIPVVIEKENQRLNSFFVEWLMGIPENHVCGNGLSRKEEFTLLGNGVVPQQAETALKILLKNVESTILEEVLKFEKEK